MAFAGGLAAVGMVYLVARAVRGHDPLLVLVLAGVVLGALLGACVALMKYLADPYNQLPAITYWLLGSLASTTASDLVPLVGPVALGTVGLKADLQAGKFPDPIKACCIAADAALTASGGCEFI